MRHGQLDAAQREVDAALAKYQTRNPPWEARFRVLKAHILVLRGSYSESLQLLKEPLPSSLTRTDAEVERKMVQGIAHDYLQQFDRAEKAVSEAESLGADINSSLLGDVAQTRGIVEIDQKNYPEATAAFLTAAAIAHKKNLPQAELNALANLGNVAMWQEHYDEALDRFKMALEKSRQVGAAAIEAKTLGNLGWNYSAVGDFENAETFLLEAQSKSAEAGLVDDQIRWLDSLAGVYSQEHRYKEADSTGQKALALAKNQDDKRTLTECLNTLSEIALATGRPDSAEQYNQQAAAIEKAGLDHFGVNYSQVISGRIAAAKQHYPQARDVFREIIRDPSVETPLKWEAQARLAQVNAAQNQPAKAEREFRSAIKTMIEAQNSLHREEFRLSFLSSGIEFYQAYIDFLVSRGRLLDALSVADLSRSQSLAESLSESSKVPAASFQRLDPQKIAARFHSTLLFYSLGLQHSYVWVITPQKTTLLRLSSQQKIDVLVKSYTQALTESPLNPLNAPNSAGATLYSILVAPAAKFIPRNSRVIILPDGSLDTFNFETLIVPFPQPHYWIEDVTLTNANSLALLARSKSALAPRNATLLLVGNPAPADSAFPSLPQAATEIADVEQYFPESRRDVLTGASATAAAYFESKPGRFQFLHFVTHGTASRLQPLESAIILSPSGDSYKLYARNIITRPLHAYLVTISACNGAGNRAYAGEGLVGLSWAFLRAGAHHVISALWEVSDVSTPQLMNSLYQGLNRGEDPATALRNAKLGLLHSHGLYGKPYYWGPFQLYSGS
jgi:CHAT domain-containing protein